MAWTLVVSVCERNLYKIRQINTALNQNRKRVRRLWLLPSTPTTSFSQIPRWQRHYPALKIAMVSSHQWQRAIQSKLPKHLAILPSSLYLIDPDARMVLVYPPDISGQSVLHDINRLLRSSSRA